MTRLRLLLEEFHPKAKHVPGADDNTADCLSRNRMKQKRYNVIKWEPRSKPLKYCNEVAKDPFVLLTQVMSHNHFEEEDWENLFETSNRTTSEFEDKYPLSTTPLHQDKCNEVDLI